MEKDTPTSTPTPNDKDTHLASRSIGTAESVVDTRESLLVRVDGVVDELEGVFESVERRLSKEEVAEDEQGYLHALRTDITHLIIGLKSNQSLLRAAARESSAADTYTSLLLYDIMRSEKILSGGDSNLIPIDPHAGMTLQELFRDKQTFRGGYVGMSDNEVLTLAQALHVQSSKLKRERVYIEAVLKSQRDKMLLLDQESKGGAVIATSLRYIYEMQAHIIGLTNVLGFIDNKSPSEQKELHSKVLRCIGDVDQFIDGVTRMKHLYKREKDSLGFSGTHIGEMSDK